MHIVSYLLHFYQRRKEVDGGREDENGDDGGRARSLQVVMLAQGGGQQ